MMRLIRNCPHDNEIVTFYTEQDGERRIIKASSNPSGIEQLKQEFSGWEWYQSKRYPDYEGQLCSIIRDSEHYVRISIRYIEGRKEKYRDGIQKNSQLINNVIRHYCKIWQGSNSNRYPLHGDMSVDNVIVNHEGVHIIDWEHFSFDASPFGFDSYNLLFEQLFFSMEGRKKLRRSELDILLDNIRLIRASSEDSLYFSHDPLLAFQRFVRMNAGLWKNQIHRLPALLFNEEKTRMIDRMIISHI
jgi:hypothetical protein